MKKLLIAEVACGIAAFAFAADVTYTEPPADTAMIKVAGGTTTVAGLEAYSHLTHYWSFDDENDPYADSVGNLPLQARSTDPVWKSGDDAKRGGAMWTKNGFKTASNFIDGKHPFTICFWYKYGNFSGSSGQESLLHIGKTPNGAQISDTPYFRVSHHNTGSPTKIDFWDNQITYKSQTISAFTSGVWHHIALVCEVVEMPDCVTSNLFTVFRNGSATSASAKLAQQELAPTDNFLIGFGWKYGGNTAPVFDATFDEVMCFDRALTADEINAFAACGAPPDFSAGWNIMVDGTLDIFGRKPLTALQGYGVAKTVEATRLEASSNAWFAGSVRSPAFTFAGASSSVTQTLSGTNGWTGATTVESGTLEIASTPVEVFGDALVAWYPFEDAVNPGRDFSPRGNNLSARTGFTYEALPAEGPLAGSGLMMSMTNCTVVSGMESGSRLNGFAAANNSFTVAFWMRDDKGHQNEGPLSFGNISGFRRNGKDGHAYWGDTSAMISLNDGSNVWGTGEWHHWVMIFDAAAAEEGKKCYFLFTDGELRMTSSNKNANYNHATQVFYLGRGMNADAANIFEAALDEVIVLNTADTNDVAKLYNFRRATVPAPREATGVLPTGTTLTVEEGATLKLSAANETVRRLTGKGTIDLSGNSTLTVTRRIDFEGNVIGGEITDGRPGIMMIVR